MLHCDPALPLLEEAAPGPALGKPCRLLDLLQDLRDRIYTAVLGMPFESMDL